MIKIGWRMWIVIIFLAISIFTISPSFKQGVEIKSIDQNSPAYETGLRAGMVLQELNGIQINEIQDYTTKISEIFPDETNPQMKITIKADNQDFYFLAEKNPEIVLGNIPRTNLKTGLDLSGGARALVRPADVSLSESEISDLIAITSQRFNSFGLKDITIRATKDLSGNNYMLIEIAGATPSDLRELVGQQGKFEAKIGNQTAFVGGKDLAHVSRSGEKVIVECLSETSCRFRFAISLTEEAAKRHAEITNKLSISSENPEYLSEKLMLYIDGNLMDELWISKDLKGQLTTEISIQGGEIGANYKEARANTENEMKKLQTILITGSLPYKLEIVKLDTISPVLGKEFARNLILLALVVFGIVSVVIFLRYRRIKLTLAVISTMFCEAFFTLGIAALISWNLDAPSIAGIIAGMGTGVNDQIVMIDESVSNTLTTSLKDRIKRALFIIVAAFFTIVAAMIPLFWAGAGMLKGFALTTIISVSIGILITRPAFAEVLKRIME